MRSTRAFISKSALINNLNTIRNIAPESQIMAVVKANAYGHGIIPISKILRQNGVEFLAVAFAEEAMALRASGDTGNIVIIAPAIPDEAELICQCHAETTVSTFDMVLALNAEAKKQNCIAKIHLYIETGMNREGIRPEESVEFAFKCKSLQNIEMVGICTHFATSTDRDKAFANEQLKLFNNTLAQLSKNNISFKYIHAANSGAIVNLKHSRFNLVRPGISLYGYPPDLGIAKKFDVEPIMTLKTKVALIRTIETGDSVGYNREYIAYDRTKIATIPIGYGDGYFKTLSHKAECLINGKRYPIVGAICMDVMMVDVGKDNINIGDDVVLIGEQGDESISAYDLAIKIGTIPYEITTAISARVPRIIVE
jgi:alanine racemase